MHAQSEFLHAFGLSQRDEDSAEAADWPDRGSRSQRRAAIALVFVGRLFEAPTYR